jgi:hypothetical protein
MSLNWLRQNRTIFSKLWPVRCTFSNGILLLGNIAISPFAMNLGLSSVVLLNRSGPKRNQSACKTIWDLGSSYHNVLAPFCKGIIVRRGMPTPWRMPCEYRAGEEIAQSRIVKCSFHGKAWECLWLQVGQIQIRGHFDWFASTCHSIDWKNCHLSIEKALSSSTEDAERILKPFQELAVQPAW